MTNEPSDLERRSRRGSVDCLEAERPGSAKKKKGIDAAKADRSGRSSVPDYPALGEGGIRPPSAMPAATRATLIATGARTRTSDRRIEMSGDCRRASRQPVETRPR